MAAKRCHAFAGPAIAVSSTKAVAVEQARNHIVAAHKCKHAYRLYDFRRGRVLLLDADLRNPGLSRKQA